MKAIIEKGYLETFVTMYFEQMKELGYLESQALWIFNTFYEKKKGINLFDIINYTKRYLAKKSKVNTLHNVLV
jgi:hypothetical protein